MHCCASFTALSHCDSVLCLLHDLVWVAVVAPIGNSDHSSLSAVISMAQAVPNLCVSRKVFLKQQVNWNTVCGAIRELLWHNIWLSDSPVEVLNELQLDHFDSKQSREAVDLPLTCNPSPSLTTFAFRSSEVRCLLLDLDPYGGTDALGMFSIFLKRTADVMAHVLL